METDILDWKLPTTYYCPKGWVRKLDLVGMVLAPIIFNLPFFFGAILFFFKAGSKGTSYYWDALVLFLVASGMLVVLGSSLRKDLKSYVHHQATRDEVMTFRLFYFGFILAGLIVDFMILYAFLYGPKP